VLEPTSSIVQHSLSDDRISFGFLRMISGDQVCLIIFSNILNFLRRLCSWISFFPMLQESKRVKFVFYVFVGTSANVMAKVRDEITISLVPYALHI
jgi:hypothetical protein